MRRWCCTGGSAKARSRSIASAIGLCIGVATIASNAEARDANWAIPAAPLQTALVNFAIQANVSLSTPPRGFGGRRAPSVRGVMSEDEVLRRLLDGTGYTFVRVNAAAYRIVPGEVASEHPAQPAYDHTEIVVTARRRPEVISTMAASASVISGEDLQGRGPWGGADLVTASAGLSGSNLGPGRNKMFLRGLSDGAFTGQSQESVGIYFGETRLTDAAPDPDLALVDIDSVEVLRGPQGALYGGGAIAGVVRIVPQAPDMETFGGMISGAVESADGGGAGMSAAAVFNAPLVADRAAVRVVAYRDVQGGWLDNPSLGLENANQTTRTGGRFALALDARNGWTIDASLVHQYLDSKDAQYVDTALDGVRPAHIAEPHDNDFRVAALSVKGPTRFGALSSTTSVLHHSFASRYDATGAFGDLGIDPSTVTAFDDTKSLKFVSEEVRLSGIASPFPWTIGAFLALGDVRHVDSVTTNPGASNALEVYMGERSDDLHRYGLFGDISFHLAPSVIVDLGARAFKTQIDASATAQATLPGLTDLFAGSYARAGFAPNIQISYQASPNAFYYALANQGSRSGGFNTGASAALSSPGGVQPTRRYAPDRIWNLEVGAKYRLFDNRLNLRLAAFHEFWENVQTDQLIALGLPFTGNVGDAHSDGVEIESTYTPFDSVQLSTQVTYAQAAIEHVATGFAAASDLPGAPELLASADLTWRRSLELGVVTLDLSGLYVGPSDVTFSDATSSEIGGYVEADVRVALTHGDWTAALYVDNVSDSHGSTFSYGSPFTLGSPTIETPLRPRVVGVEIRRSF